MGLLCLQGAKTGGESRLASAWTVYNRILEERPDLLEVLYEPFAWDRNGEESPGEDTGFPLPVLSEVADSPRMFFIGWYIRDAQRHPGAPALSPEQVEAIEMIELVANDPAVHVEMEFRPGDIQWLANDRIFIAGRLTRTRRAINAGTCCACGWRPTAMRACTAVLRSGIPTKDGVEPPDERS